MVNQLPAGDHVIPLTVNGLARKYILHVPATSTTAPRPLVLFLHGTGGTAKWAMDEARFAPFADQRDFVAVFPQALPPDPTQPPKFIANPPSWNAGGLLFPGHRPDDLKYFAILFDDLATKMNIDWRRVYVTGFSNGASMTFELAAHFGPRIAAIAPVAGYCRVKEPPEHAVPTLFIIGSADPIVCPYGGTFVSPWTGEIAHRPAALNPISLMNWIVGLGADPLPELVSNRDGIRIEHHPGPVEFTTILVDGLGHHWPGGRGQLKKKLAGEPSDRLPANEVIWEFFCRHSSADQ